MAALPKHICHVGVIVERARRQQLVVLVAVKVVRRTGRVSVAVPAFIVYHVAALAVAVNAVKLVLGEQARVLLERKVELCYVVSRTADGLRNNDCGRLPVAHAPRFA